MKLKTISTQQSLVLTLGRFCFKGDDQYIYNRLYFYGVWTPFCICEPRPTTTHFVRTHDFNAVHGDVVQVRPLADDFEY